MTKYEKKWRGGSPDLLHINTLPKKIIAILARETAVAEKKSYDFSESGTTFFWEQLSRCCISSIQNCISCSTQRRQLKNVRAWVYRAWVFSKNRFHFHTPLSTGLSSPFPRFWRFTNVSHQICESDVKRLRPLSHARNAREPLYTGTSCINCESERFFWKRKKHLQSLCKCLILHVWTSQGLNLGLPDYEYLKVIFYDISLFWKCTEYQRFTKMRFPLNIIKYP